MTDLQLKSRIFKNPITTVLSLLLAAGAVAMIPGDWRANTFAVAVAVVGSLMKDPGKKAEK